jgi:hypothetical protein
MTESETHIMRHFKLYGIRVNEMLCFNELANSQPARFHAAMASLVQRGFVVAERRRDAFSLTSQGYCASLTA